jgi:peptide deformylase
MENKKVAVKVAVLTGALPEAIKNRENLSIQLNLEKQKLQEIKEAVQALPPSPENPVQVLDKLKQRPNDLPPPARIVLWSKKVVSKVCSEIWDFDSKEIPAIIELLKSTMYHHRAVGLAAPQIGQFCRIALAHWPQSEPPMVLINPIINPVKTSGHQRGWEGCLSLPGASSVGRQIPNRGQVTRSRKLELTWQDETGRKHEAVFEDMKATVIQHEVDHLWGQFFVERTGDLARSIIMRNFGKFLDKRAVQSKDGSFHY